MPSGIFGVISSAPSQYCIYLNLCPCLDSTVSPKLASFRPLFSLSQQSLATEWLRLFSSYLWPSLESCPFVGIDKLVFLGHFWGATLAFMSREATSGSLKFFKSIRQYLFLDADFSILSGYGMFLRYGFCRVESFYFWPSFSQHHIITYILCVFLWHQKQILLSCYVETSCLY